MEVKEKLKLLLKELQNENIDAFDEFYAITKKNVYFAIYMLFKDEAITEDLMQETYINFLENKHKIKPNSDIVGYLVLSAKNKAINYYRKKKYESEYAHKLVDESYSQEEPYDTGLLKKIRSILDDQEYDVFVLKVLGEYSFKEISNLRKIPIGTCTWLYQKARNELEEKLGGNR